MSRIAAVIDTHAVIWWLFDNPRLSERVRVFIETAAESGDKLAVSSITLIEIVYLIEKGRIAVEAFSTLARILENPNGVFAEAPINLGVARVLNRVEVARVPDMPDRIIAATALHRNVPVISKDRKIQVSGLDTIW